MTEPIRKASERSVEYHKKRDDTYAVETEKGFRNWVNGEGGSRWSMGYNNNLEKYRRPVLEKIHKLATDAEYICRLSRTEFSTQLHVYANQMVADRHRMFNS